MPDTCDICGKEIDSEKQYCMQVFEGRSTFSNERSRAKNIIDCCHKCFLGICENGYKPNFIQEIKNENWVSGSKKADEKYFIPVPEVKTHSKVFDE